VKFTDRTTRPVALQVLPEGIPGELKELDYWVPWSYEWRWRNPNDTSTGGEWSKPPHNGEKSNDPATWHTFQEALELYQRLGLDGLYIAHPPDRSITSGDLDDCVADGELLQDAHAIVKALNTYTEYSPSGNGIRTFSLGSKPGIECKHPKEHTFEMYDDVRFVSVTGHRYDGTPEMLNDNPAAIAAGYSLMFPDKGAVQSTIMTPGSSASQLDDRHVIQLAKQAENGDLFIRLFYDGDWSGYPSESEAAYALLGLLRFWCKADTTQMERIFRESAIYHLRPEKRERLIDSEVSKIIAAGGDVYEPSGQVPESVREGLPMTASDMTRGDRLLLKVVKKSKVKGKHFFKYLYDKTGLPEDCPSGISAPRTQREAISILVENLANWCNGDTERMTRLLLNSRRIREASEGDANDLAHWIALAAESVVDGFIDADVIEYLQEGSRGLVVSTDLVAKEILANYHFLTATDTKEVFVFKESVYEGDDETRRIGIYDKAGATAIDTEVRTLLKHRYSTSNVKEVTGIIRAETYRDRDEIDSAPLHLIPLHNGVYDLNADKLVDYDPDVPFFIIYAGGYRPELLNKETVARTCIETILPEYIGDGDELADPNTSIKNTVSDATVYQEIGGSCFYRAFLFKTALMFFGPKDSGKSILLAILRNAIGNKARSNRTLQDLTSNRFAEASLYQKTANIAADIGSLGIDNVGRFNELTGSVDTQTCERKGVDGFEFESYATLVFSTNDLPALSPKVQKAEAEAFYSRWVLIETTRQFVPDPDPDIPNEVKEDGLLKGRLLDQENLDYSTTWFIDGLRRALKQGAYSEGDSAFNVKERWVNNTDSLAAYADLRLEHTPGFHTPAAELTADFRAYCIRIGKVEASPEMIGRRLPHLIPGTEKYESHGKWWRNLTIKGSVPLKSDESHDEAKGFYEPINDGDTRLKDF
jgi:phage/plasmid-associated DNA primase